MPYLPADALVPSPAGSTADTLDTQAQDPPPSAQNPAPPAHSEAVETRNISPLDEARCEALLAEVVTAVQHTTHHGLARVVAAKLVQKAAQVLSIAVNGDAFAGVAEPHLILLRRSIAALLRIDEEMRHTLAFKPFCPCGGAPTCVACHGTDGTGGFASTDDATCGEVPPLAGTTNYAPANARTPEAKRLAEHFFAVGRALARGAAHSSMTALPSSAAPPDAAPSAQVNKPVTMAPTSVPSGPRPNWHPEPQPGAWRGDANR